MMALSVTGGVFVGVYADRYFGGNGILVAAGVLLGIAGGGLGAYQLLAREVPWNR
ncbi:MAG: AtpZ/AtpI family protein [Candidatus Hydrogenedentes bacterium]|nr:AtpZ/AtpI family protein [Candidatus Hydrogenedentota bacterium]